MAEVWKAKYRGAAGFERTLVVKRILPELLTNEDFVAMFMREAQLCSMLSHANIVQVFELGELDGEYYLAMEYVNGKDVLAVVRARPKSPPPPGFAVLVARDVCRALAYAYDVVDERGQPLHVIHRDVTPSNIMVTIDGNVKLVDFGVAKALNTASASLTQVGGLKGKIGYAAPEQILGKAVDHRTDLYAVGIVAHELLTGRRLFQGETDQESFELALSSTVYPPSRINPQVPAALDAIVLRALERDPAKRFQSGTEMADALDPFLYELAFGPTQLSALLRERFAELETGDSSFAWIDDGVTESQDAVPMLQLSDADTDPHGGAGKRRTVSSKIARRTASYVNTIDDMGAWLATAESRDTQEHQVVSTGTTTSDELRPTLQSHPVRVQDRLPEKTEPSLEPPGELVTTANVPAPRPGSRGVLSSLASGAGGAVVGALGLAAYLHLAASSTRAGHAPAKVSATPAVLVAPAPPPPPPPPPSVPSDPQLLAPSVARGPDEPRQPHGSKKRHHSTTSDDMSLLKKSLAPTPPPHQANKQQRRDVMDPFKN